MSPQKVQLYIYDLSGGMAATISPMLLGKEKSAIKDEVKFLNFFLTGKKIDGIWHTSIVVYNREYFYGSRGVESCVPGTTALRNPLKIEDLGETHVPYPVFLDYLNGLSESSYKGSTYHLLQHNCNNFSHEIAHFLCGAAVPKYILDLPNEVLNSSLSSVILALVAQLENSARPIAEEQSSDVQKELSPDFDQLNSQIDEERYNSFLLEERRKTLRETLARKKHKRDKTRRRISRESRRLPVESKEEFVMADAEVVNGESHLPSDEAIALEEEERREEDAKKKARDPPIVYKDLIDVKAEFDTLIGLIDGKLTPEEQRSTEELHQYMVGRLLHDEQFPLDVRVRILNILAMAAMKDDVILVLHQDRKDHVLMNYAFEIDRLTPEEQEAIALFVS
ncbi:unnamed protein product [Phaedon cochleariae]|uniref:PPPDE domain-containing protein n=1 Tax=Phaedon cochleariae TaxID=80249 RepID=A0A9N9X215_PHACE|nr:unnamed protein product [Phaedon cochleariae]